MKSRYIVTPQGQLYLLGGYFPLLQLYSAHTFFLDEHRSTLVPLRPFSHARADQAVLLYK